MTPAIKEGLDKLIAAIDERRASMNRRKAELLTGEATWSAGQELIALNLQLDHLRLAEDILSDAMTALEQQIKDEDGDRAA
jgi:hypothetical protein